MWSSQHYIEQGRKIGREDSLLECAVQQIEVVIELNPNLPSILTLNHLAQRTNIAYKSLRKYVTRSSNSYRSFLIRKHSGGMRRISIPEPDLMNVQRWIAKYILNQVPVHRNSFAYSPDSTIVKCAAKHCGAQWLIKIDVCGFFSSLSEIQVYRVFRSLGYQRLISFEMARICTLAPERSPTRYRLTNWQNRHEFKISAYNRDGIGYLPQGAPTSPMLSNLIMRELDQQITRMSKKIGLQYSRYADDMTFSTRSKKFDRSIASKFIWNLKKLLISDGLYVNSKKTVVSPPGAKKSVLGLLVDGSLPRLSRAFREGLRQHLYYLETLGAIEHARNRNFETVGGMRRHVRGLIDFASMVDEAYGTQQMARFDRIDWP